MDAKLTLKLNKNVINNAKNYASTQKISLSRIIESYLNSLVSRTRSEDNDEIQIKIRYESVSMGECVTH